MLYPSNYEQGIKISVQSVQLMPKAEQKKYLKIRVHVNGFKAKPIVSLYVSTQSRILLRRTQNNIKQQIGHGDESVKRRDVSLKMGFERGLIFSWRMARLSVMCLLFVKATALKWHRKPFHGLRYRLRPSDMQQVQVSRW